MTPQEKLHAVETAIRKALPRLMKPTEGCLVIFRNVKNKKQSGKILYNFGQDFYRIFCKNESDEYLRRRNEVEILGHDILLNDVLEWLKELELSNKIKSFEIGFTPMGQFVIKQKEVIVFWDLSKPRLADQSEKLINFLYNLIKNN